MSKLLTEQQESLFILTLNNIEKRNAFDDELLTQLQQALTVAEQTPSIQAIVLKANGKHFSAGADLTWMKRMVDASEADNYTDALHFAHVLQQLYQSSKPTIALVQGAAYGGGIGLIAACDIAIATQSAQFCFSEVTLGLIPAVISPYVIQAIGPRVATALFLSAERFDSERALAIQLIHHCVPDEDLLSFGLHYALSIATHPPKALQQAKALVRAMSHRAIDKDVVTDTAKLIAKIRVSAEAQAAIQLFLNPSSG